MTNPLDQRKPITQSYIEYPELKTDWVVESLIPAAKLAYLGGAPSSFKSWLASYISICIATGEPVLNWLHTGDPCRVCYYTGDDNETEYTQRFRALTRGIGYEDNDPMLSNIDVQFVDDPIDLNNTNNRRYLEDAVQGYRFVVLDTQVHFSGQTDENNPTEMHQFLSPIRGIAKRSGCAIMFVHHTRKSDGRPVTFDDLRGSSAIRGACRSLLMVEAAEHSPLIKLKTQCRYARQLPTVTVQIDINEELSVAVVTMPAVNHRDFVLGALSKSGEEGVTTFELANLSGGRIDEDNARRILNSLEKKGLSERISKQGKVVRWGPAIPEGEKEDALLSKDAVESSQKRARKKRS